MPRAPSIVISNKLLEIACSAATRARSSPAALPTAISAAPPSDMIVRTSAKSRLIRPGTVINSLIPWIPCLNTSSASLKASCRLARLSAIWSNRSFGITIRVSTCSFSFVIPSSAVLRRLAPSNVNGRVTTPIVKAPTSLAIWAMIGPPPVPVPPPIPAAMNTMSEPLSTS